MIMDSPLVSPWFKCFSENYEALREIGGQIPPNMRAAYDALLKAGATIKATIDNETAVSSDDAKAWLEAAKKFALGLHNARSAEIAATSDCGIATPDDGPLSGLDVLTDQAGAAIAATIKALVDHAADTVNKALKGAVGAMPWGWITVGVVAVFVIPSLIQQAEGGAPRKRHARAA